MNAGVERVQTGGGEPVHVLDAVVHGVEPPQEGHLVGEPVAPVAPEQHDDGRERRRHRPGEGGLEVEEAQGDEGERGGDHEGHGRHRYRDGVEEEVGEVGDETGPQHPLALQRHGPLEGHEHQTQQRDARRAPGAG